MRCKTQTHCAITQLNGGPLQPVRKNTLLEIMKFKLLLKDQ